MEFFSHQTNFRFMATRKVWFTLSILLMIASLTLLATRGLNWAVDFTGGVTAQASFPATADLSRVRTQLADAGFHDAVVTYVGNARSVAIRLPPERGQSSTQLSGRIERALQRVNPGATVLSVSVVGPQVGSQLKHSAMWALGFTLLFIFLYIAWRFHTWRLSLGAILAVMHDPILVLGFFALSHISFNLNVVAAVLAVIGYSLNDTVVVFDRIRERFEGNRRLAPEVVLDQAINQTLSRTIMTKVVTAIVVVALLVLGGPVLRGFAAALLIGILAGTYSSIYISSAVALQCGLTAEHLFPTVRKTAVDHLP